MGRETRERKWREICNRSVLRRRKSVHGGHLLMVDKESAGTKYPDGGYEIKEDSTDEFAKIALQAGYKYVCPHGRVSTSLSDRGFYCMECRKVDGTKGE
jgi:hypothetical protein